jgi:hypothetical protein
VKSMKTVTLLMAVLAISAPAFGVLLNGDMALGTAVVDLHPQVDGRITSWNIYDLHNTPADGHSTAYGTQGSYTRWTMTTTGYSGNSAFFGVKGGNTNGAYFGIYQTVTDLNTSIDYTISSMINSNSNLTKGTATQFGYYLFVTDGSGFVKPDDSLAYASGRSNNLFDTGKTSGWVGKSTTFRPTSSTMTFTWLAYVDSDPAASAGLLFAVDNVVLTPEPAALALLGLPLLLIRRRRAW